MDAWLVLDLYPVTSLFYLVLHTSVKRVLMTCGFMILTHSNIVGERERCCVEFFNTTLYDNYPCAIMRSLEQEQLYYKHSDIDQTSHITAIWEYDVKVFVFWVWHVVHYCPLSILQWTEELCAMTPIHAAWSKCMAFFVHNFFIRSLCNPCALMVPMTNCFYYCCEKY